MRNTIHREAWLVTVHGVARVSPDLAIKQLITHRAWSLSKNLDSLLSTPQPIAWSSSSFSSPLCFYSSLTGINKNNLLNADHRHCAKCLHTMCDCILTATLKSGRITFTDKETGSHRLENLAKATWPATCGRSQVYIQQHPGSGPTYIYLPA